MSVVLIKNDNDVYGLLIGTKISDLEWPWTA